MNTFQVTAALFKVEWKSEGKKKNFSQLADGKTQMTMINSDKGFNRTPGIHKKYTALGPY